ncbi:MAG: carboxymuconolactone decarboxylase family protein [Pirellulaceae bacterium]|jgi:hypothetical protein|nr:carboxymuconolactone decarboxylase family protein [Pirellulaceae bacterium]MDP7018045.1 carboxymuconolactone decarboxylase family protein [Pirellulaceae bacterium]
MPFINWVEDDQATGPVADIYDAWKQANPQREKMPDILKCFSSRADVLGKVIELSYPLHFQDGSLTRRTKEMIATLVSALNQCPY